MILILGTTILLVCLMGTAIIELGFPFYGFALDDPQLLMMWFWNLVTVFFVFWSYWLIRSIIEP